MKKFLKKYCDSEEYFLLIALISELLYCIIFTIGYDKWNINSSPLALVFIILATIIGMFPLLYLMK